MGPFRLHNLGSWIDCPYPGKGLTRAVRGPLGEFGKLVGPGELLVLEGLPWVYTG